MGPSLMFLGALVAWASYENHRLKLLAIAVAGPALITTWAGGATAATKFSLNMIDSAYAADAAVTTNQDVSVGNAIKLFFGIGKDDDRFRVVVGSYKDRTEAALVVERIKKEDPALVVFVGERQPNNQFYPVIVGDYVSYPEATKLKDRVQSLNAVSGAYLSPYRYR